MNSFYYFPTVIYRDEQPQFVDSLIKFSKNYFQQDENICQTNNMVKEKNISFFVDYLKINAESILLNQGYLTEKYEIYVSYIWGQRLKYGTNVHVHKNSQLCGWIFLKTPVNGSYPLFYDPRLNKKMIEMDYIENENVNISTSIINFNNIKPGTILLTNSWLEHQLTPSKSEELTETLHFIISCKEKLCNMY